MTLIKGMIVNGQTTAAGWIRGAVLIGCSVLSLATLADERIGTVQSPLISEVPVTEIEQERLGLLSMGAFRRGCSASLLTNSWAISASHCMSAAAIRAPNNITLSSSWGANSQSINADYVYRSWGLDESGFYDFALIHLQRPFRVNGATTGYKRELSELSLQDMMNVNVAVYGRGMSRYAFKDDKGVDQMSFSDGRYRSFVFQVNRIEQKLFWYPKGPNGQSVGGGDSGGPSFEMSRLIPRIAGVHALCHNTCLAGHSCPATDPWTWTSDIGECADAPVGYLRGAINDILPQVWNPALPVQTVQMQHSEAQVQKELLLGYIDQLPWDYARRAAMIACMHRGFDFGFLDGNHVANQRYQVRCVNDSAGRWHDAGVAEISRVNDRFQTLPSTSWAQGARAANDICKNLEPASVGGLFTGFEVLIRGENVFADQKDGVFCFNNTNAVWMDSTLGELAAQGTPIGDLNATNWGAAARAASEYCRRKNYPSGGFFNGHQLNDKRGVVCLGPNNLTRSARSEVLNYSETRTAIAAERKPVAVGARSAMTTQSAVTGRIAAIPAAGNASAPAPAASSAPASTAFYAIDGKGALIRYAHTTPESGTVPERSVAAASGWNAYTAVIPAGGNHLYARASNGDLLWFEHDPASGQWKGPVKVGSGWQSFTQLIGGGNGVIYAIAPDGALVWYRHSGFATGAAGGWLGPNKVGSGWGGFKSVFSTGNGVIYAIAQDGKLLAYHHLDPDIGQMRWTGPAQVGTGWGGFAQTFSAGNGVIYGIAPDGKLSYYRNLTWNLATPTFQWVGPVAVGQGDPGAKVVAVLP